MHGTVVKFFFFFDVFIFKCHHLFSIKSYFSTLFCTHGSDASRVEILFLFIYLFILFSMLYSILKVYIFSYIYERFNLHVFYK